MLVGIVEREPMRKEGQGTDMERLEENNYWKTPPQSLAKCSTEVTMLAGQKKSTKSLGLPMAK